MNSLPHAVGASADPSLWPLDPRNIYLNHGSFGACPRAVLDFQSRVRERMERDPMRFFVHELEPLLDAARAALAAFVGADAQDLVLVPNATFGVNSVLQSLAFSPGDELLVTDQEYNASRNALNHVARKTGAAVIVVQVPFPVESAEAIVEAVLARVTSRTKLALLDHVTSQTGLVLPVERIAAELDRRGVEVLIDGAHAPGMVSLSIRALPITYYTGNCHKWICSPKGAGFLWVRGDRQNEMRPLAISHGANSRRQDRSRFLIEFGWTGTSDPSAWLSVPEALTFFGSLLPGGWPDVMQRNRALVLRGRAAICEALGIAAPCPDNLIGSLASIPLPDAVGSAYPPPLFLDPLQEELFEKHRIEAPIISWPAFPKRLLRVSAQLYNSFPQYEKMAAALRELLP